MTRASIVIPTRGPRLASLEAALAVVAPQAAVHDADVVVVTDDAPDPATRALAERLGARYLALGAPRGINVARNAGLEAAAGDLLCLLDDDAEPWDGWLGALLAAADAQPGHEAFGGPIRPRLADSRLPRCGREPLPITALDLGTVDRDADRLWGANLAVRRAALERVGWFDPALNWAGDEEEWEDRLLAADGRMRYVAAAGVDHVRRGPDARLEALVRAAHARGRAARRFDRARDRQPPLATEGRVLAGCAWHTLRRRCAFGILMGAHALGRTREALRPTDRAAAGAPVHAAGRPGAGGSAGAAEGRGTGAGLPDVFSGESGTLGRRTTLVGGLRDALEDLLVLPRRLALARAARSGPRQRVLVLTVARPEHATAVARAARELGRSRHDVAIRAAAPLPGAGKWENLDRLLHEGPTDGFDWLLVLDDDVVLPRGFLDAFLFCCGRFDLALAQPAHKHRSHAAWRVTRRRPGTVARTTAFVEIGPVTAFNRRAVARLLPFPDLHMGWGLDAHWAAVAAEHGLRLGVVDATPVRHLQPVAGGYGRERALREAREFLADRPYVERATAQRTLAEHKRW